MLEVINDFLSGKVLIVLIVGLGGYFTIRSRFVQLRHFFHMFAVFRDSLKSSAGQLSSFQALMLSLAGRVGAGNIAGVGIAVTLGGPGAVFWMWVTALVGMSSSFIECSLGQLYKRTDAEGTYRGGPAYYIQYGLHKRWLGMVMAFLLLVTFGFAFNGLQAHAVTHSLNNAFGLDTTYTGLARWIAATAMICGIGLVIFSQSRYFLLSAAVIFFVGFAATVQMAATNTIVQSRVPDALRGRVMAVYATMFMGVQPVGSLIAGGIAKRIGAPYTLTIFGLFVLAASCVFIFRVVMRLQKAPAEPSAAAANS